MKAYLFTEEQLKQLLGTDNIDSICHDYEMYECPTNFIPPWALIALSHYADYLREVADDDVEKRELEIIEELLRNHE